MQGQVKAVHNAGIRGEKVSISAGSLHIIKISDIQPKPPYNVTVTISENVRLIESAILSGAAYPRAVLARYSGKLYPVGNLETVQAAQSAGIKEMECIVEDAHTMGDVVKSHISHSRSRTYNPISLMSALDMLEESGDGLDDVPSEIRMIHRLDLDGSVKSRIDSFITDIGKNRSEVPSIIHILHPISKIKKTAQREALNHIIDYSTFGSVFIPPDTKILKTILAKFHTPAHDARKVTVEPVQKEPNMEPPNTARPNVDIDVVKSPDEMGTNISSINNVTQHTCQCGKKYMVNHNDGLIREVVDVEGQNIIALKTDSGSDENAGSTYALSKNDSDYLDLEMSPTVYTYRLGPAKSGNAVLICRSRIGKTILAKITAMLEKQRQ